MNLPREGFICNQHNDQLPVDLLSQLVERCTDIKNVKQDHLLTVKFTVSCAYSTNIVL